MFIPLAHEPTIGGNLAADPFQCVESQGHEVNGLYSSSTEGSDVERVFEATQVQQDICKERIQWATAELPFLTPAPSFQAIVNAWNSLASYHSSLRANLYTDPRTGHILVRVLRRIEHIAPASWSEDVSDEKLAHLVWEPSSSSSSSSSSTKPTTIKGGNGAPSGFKLRLNFRRALLDARSLEMIKADFLLLLAGHPPLERTGFTAYTRFVKQSKSVDRAREFWEQTLGDAVAPSAGGLFSSPSSPSKQQRQSLTVTLSDIPPSYTFSSEAGASSSRRSLFELTWALVLSEHTDTEDVVIGTVGRDETFLGADSTVGCLDQTYLLRVDTRREAAVQELASSIEAYHAEAASHAFVGLNSILRALPPQKTVESAVNYTAGSFQCLAPGLSRFPVVLTICDARQPKLTLTYVDSIAKQDAEVLLDQFVTGIRSLFSTKHTEKNYALSKVQLVSEKEKARLLSGPTISPQKWPPTLATLVEAGVKAYPSRTAVSFEDEPPLTYLQVNGLANGLAKSLKLKKGSIVPLLMDRSARLVVVILALLKSGVAYTILNPDMPVDRNAQVIKECDPPIILADKKYSCVFPLARNVEDCLATAAAQATQDNDWGQEKPTPDDVSYIIYTSGSTGKPKGTLVTHRAAANGIMQHPSLDDMPRVLLFYSPTASAAQRTFVSTLVQGGTIVLASKDSLANDLAGVINKQKVDVMEITPTALSLLRPTDIPNIKQITVAGETIPQALIDLWAANENLIVRNRYGSSECTQMSLGRRLHVNDNPRDLGSPQDTTVTYILRVGSNELAPTGVAGELCLSGPQLAKGYLNEPGLTDRVFVPNPFGKGRMYRTGDRARRFADGSIEILSRIDWQVKINGNKVEPSDVDFAISQHPSVAVCASFATEVGGELALVTAVVPADPNASWPKLLPVLRKHAIDSLPSYMVPSLWLPLAELPRSVNGKVDLKNLRQKSQELGREGFAALSSDADEEGAITDDLELKIARVWASVLGVSAQIIGRTHSFLSLGGNSLQAIKAISRLRAEGIVADFSSLLTDKSIKEVADASRLQASSATPESQVEPFSMVKDVEFLGRLRKQMKITDAYPATPLQAGLLVTLNEEGDHYVYRRVYEIGHLDLAKLKESFTEVFALNDMLRTGFVLNNRSFIQVVREDVNLPWVESHLTLDEYRRADEKIDLPLAGPLFRVGIVSKKWLVLTMHHALCDFWSHSFLYQDVAASYLGRNVPSRPRYANFVRYVFQQDTPVARSFWSTYLAGAPQSRLNHAPTGETARISRKTTLDLHAKSNALGLTAGSVIYTAWAIVLSRQQNSDDVIFATTLSGRETPVLGVESIDGPTITTVPQRLGIKPDQTLLGLAKDVCMENFVKVTQHAQIGMQRALQSANLPSDSFDTLVNILVKEDRQEYEDLFKQHGDRPIWSTPYTLLEIIPEAGQTTIRMSSELEAKRLEFLCDSFIKVASAIVNTPQQLVSAVDVIADAERAYLNNMLSNRDTLRNPPPQFLHAEFEKRARLNPNHTAIDWEGVEQVSYASLDHRANYVAGLIAQRGLQPGDRIALMLEKSIEAVVCIIASLKAGVAYVPLSPENPAERNAFICEQTGTQLIILHKEQEDFASVVPGLQAIIVEDIPAIEEKDAPITSATPDNVAYIIYTSGSTGQPKGIEVPHRAAAAAIESGAVVERRFEGQWRQLQMSNYVFDVSVMDIFTTLSTGGTLCMAPMDKLLSDMAGCMRDMHVRQAALTPTVASLVQPSEVPSLETLILAGEQLPQTVVNTWRPHVRMLNSYGPTETAMIVFSKEVQLDGSPSTNIGRPYRTVMAFVLDPDGDALRPYGAVGELCIAGPQLSYGYLGREDLTAAAFMHSETLGLRIYRTGDLARWLPGGDLECLGRKDNQIKIHGYRVELGEVESAIRQTGHVSDVVVMLANVHDKPQLVAACVFKSDEEQKTEGSQAITIEPAEKHQETVSALRQQLNSLAHYMVPKVVIPMNDFPILPSHKTDRKALKKMIEDLDAITLSSYVLETAGEQHEIVPTETPVEKSLEAMWAKILDLAAGQIGREANFLSLGGDSIAAISLASMARQAGFSLAVPTILKFPKLKELATKMTVVEQTSSHVKPVFTVSQSIIDAATSVGLDWDNDIEYVYPCPPGQTEFLKQGSHEKQLWVLHTVRRFPASVDQDRWIWSTSELTKACDILRTSWLQTSPTEWVGLVFKSPEIDVTRVSCQGEAEASEIIEGTWEKRFVFGKSFIRYTIITYPDGSWDLVTKLDHAVYDGTLLRIFDDHHKAILRGQPIPRHTQFKDFVFHIFEQDKSRSLGYWTKRLEGWDTATSQNKAAWAKAPAPCTNAVIKRPLATEGVDDTAKGLGVTPSILFQGAFQLWLGRAGSINDVGFDYLLTGRNVELPEPQTINGTVANFLPMRATIDPDETLANFLGRTQDDFWAMTDYGDVGLDQIYQAAKLDRMQVGNRVLFIFQPFEPASPNDPEAHLRWLVMAKCKVRMPTPYVLAVEVHKAPGKTHSLKVSYDKTILEPEAANQAADEICEIIHRLCSLTGNLVERKVSEV